MGSTLFLGFSCPNLLLVFFKAVVKYVGGFWPISVFFAG